MDLNLPGNFEAGADLNVVMNVRFQQIELQGAAERAPFTGVELQKLLNLAAKGISELLATWRAALSLD